MALYASLNDRVITEAEIQIPRVGIWCADVALDDGAAIANGTAVTLKLAGLTLAGTVRRGESWQGAWRGRVVGGSDGWRKEIGPAGYRSPLGVHAGIVLRDAARAVGETVSLDADFSVGPFFARMRGPAARLLSILDVSWYMRTDGVTVVGARPGGSIATPFDVIDGSPELGTYTIATEYPEDFAPGRSLVSATIAQKTISAVVHRLNAGNLRTVVWA